MRVVRSDRSAGKGGEASSMRVMDEASRAARFGVARVM